MGRTQWTTCSDKQLLRDCEVDLYRASGPGGQKRNKTSSAVRLRHRPSGVCVIAEESRSQAENKVRALRRLRQRMNISIREEFPPEDNTLLHVIKERNLRFGKKEDHFWAVAGVVLDALDHFQGRLREASEALGAKTAWMGDFIKKEPKVWEEANRIRRTYDLRPLS